MKLPDTTSSQHSEAYFPKALDLFSPSWQAVRKNAGIIAFYFIISILFSIAIEIASNRASQSVAGSTGVSFMEALQAQYTPTVWAITILSYLFGIIIAPTLTVALIKGARGESISLEDAFRATTGLIWRNFLLSLIISLVVGIGFILLIVPGLFLLKRYLLAPYYLIDQDLPVMEALKASARDSATYSKPVWTVIGTFALIGLTLIVPLLGILAFLVLCVMYMAAPALRYLQIQAVKAGSK